MISEEAVEAAAKALYDVFPSLIDSTDETTAVPWESASEQRRAEDRAQARAALEAAAPYMMDRERTAELIAEYGNELVGSSGGPEHLEYTYSDAILGVAE